ncbi:hypothetical protein BOTBODRAFT_446417 [Botryobasidium botryosum FD-172 SS1]|uniref:Uncharacterized protein n=1 Tax=Botryobasidium botryosum (strain FD-172 SS1) TaxID=930990 RepID=A0A067M899_BOTB1|nr:hypothetical protein BOTBODRAFT_446417 [Botryobasidium botryosum FD-172 SS1]
MSLSSSGSRSVPSITQHLLHARYRQRPNPRSEKTRTDRKGYQGRDSKREHPPFDPRLELSCCGAYRGRPGAFVPWTPPHGYESDFGVNHLGHFLFTARIFPKLREAGAPRVVNVSSDSHAFSPVNFDDLDFDGGRGYDRWKAYSQSKSANILFSRELARRGVLSFSLNPGAIRTNLQDQSPEVTQDLINLGVFTEKGETVDSDRVTWKTQAQGTSTHIIAAFDPSIVSQPGSYLEDGQVHNERLAPHAADPEAARKLWDLSEKLVGEKFVIST